MASATERQERVGEHVETSGDCRDDKAISLWAAYFEPQAVPEKPGIKLAVDGEMNALSRRTHSWAPEERAGLAQIISTGARP
jgi:hypothetical protein